MMNYYHQPPTRTLGGDEEQWWVPEAPIDSRFWGRINGVWDLAVAIAGAVMQGRLFLHGNPVDPMEAVPLQYLEDFHHVIDGGIY